MNYQGNFYEIMIVDTLNEYLKNMMAVPHVLWLLQTLKKKLL